MILPVTLSAFAAAAILTLWMMIRCGKVRVTGKVLHGDGGNALLAQRMRAQLNFVESAPFILGMFALIESAGKGGAWLPWVAGLYVVARIAHVFGMDRNDANIMRGAGVMITMLMLAGLAIYCGLIAARVV